MFNNAIAGVALIIIGALFTVVLVLTSRNSSLQKDVNALSVSVQTLKQKLDGARFTASQIKDRELLFKGMQRVPTTTDINKSNGNHTLNI